MLYFNKECFEELLAAFYACAVVNLANKEKKDLVTVDQKITDWYETVHFLLEKVQEAGYRVDRLQEVVS
jgi:hypothetical protein